MGEKRGIMRDGSYNAAGAADWIGLIELIVIFALVMGFCAWELWRIRRDQNSDD